jgi:hypothetical protein
LSNNSYKQQSTCSRNKQPHSFAKRTFTTVCPASLQTNLSHIHSAHSHSFRFSSTYPSLQSRHLPLSCKQNLELPSLVKLHKMLRINILTALLVLLSSFLAGIAAQSTTVTTSTSTCTITKTVSHVVATAVVTGYPPLNTTSISYTTYANSTTIVLSTATPTANSTTTVNKVITPTAAIPTGAASGYRASLIATWLVGSVVAFVGYVL